MGAQQLNHTADAGSDTVLEGFGGQYSNVKYSCVLQSRSDPSSDTALEGFGGTYSNVKYSCILM